MTQDAPRTIDEVRERALAAGAYIVHGDEKPSECFEDLVITLTEVDRLQELLLRQTRLNTEMFDAGRKEAEAETVEIVLPLTTWLCEHEPDRYGGRHCIDVAIELLDEARALVGGADVA